MLSDNDPSKHNPNQRHSSIGHKLKGRVKMSGRLGAGDVLMSSVQMALENCASNQMMHTSHGFIGDPKHLAIVATFTVCPDELATELRSKLDASAAEFLSNHSIHIR